MARATEQIIFTAFIGLVIIGALFVAREWPVRASIIILLLGGIGVILTGIQLAVDYKAMRTEKSQITRLTFEVQAIEHQGRWGSLEIWAWLWGLFFAIHLIGFPIALPLFVFLYVKLYGGAWLTTIILTAVTWGFLYGIYEYVLSVPWPKPWLAYLF
jgi:Tripartite tricarboxylate transporter TctB family